MSCHYEMYAYKYVPGFEGRPVLYFGSSEQSDDENALYNAKRFCDPIKAVLNYVVNCDTGHVVFHTPSLRHKEN